MLNKCHTHYFNCVTCQTCTLNTMGHFAIFNLCDTQWQGSDTMARWSLLAASENQIYLKGGSKNGTEQHCAPPCV